MMHSLTDDLRIVGQRPLLSPAVLAEALPVPVATQEFVLGRREAVREIIEGRDSRLLVVVGPCSVHDPVAAIDYAGRLKTVADDLERDLLIVMRVYFEKPRTVNGWKGLINDPGIDGGFQVNTGLRIARELLLNVSALRVPAATEFLDNMLGQFFAELVSWGAIGARTVESQIHRELASGLSMPVGFKNRTDGDVRVAIDAIRSARTPHWFPSVTKEGAPAILSTRGNTQTHLVLRGGSVSGPNFGPDSIIRTLDALEVAGLRRGVMVDCSHGNSGKNPRRQPVVAEAVARQIEGGQHGIFGVMLESNIEPGRQEHGPGIVLRYGQSITDGCLGFEETVPILERLAAAVRARRPARV